MSVNPLPSMQLAAPSELPSGLRRLTYTSQLDCPVNWSVVVPAIEMRCEAVPANVSDPFWPGVSITTDADAPACVGTIVPAKSAGTSYSVSVPVVTAVVVGSRITEYVAGDRR